jgi:hypothetical protein
LNSWLSIKAKTLLKMMMNCTSDEISEISFQDRKEGRAEQMIAETFLIASELGFLVCT